MRYLAVMFLLACLPSPSQASILLNMTSGSVDVIDSRIRISLAGYDSTGLPFVLTAAGNGGASSIHPQGWHDAGWSVSPGLHVSGLDVRNVSLSIDGNTIVENIPTFSSFFSITIGGPSFVLPAPPASQSLNGPVDFSISFVYRPGSMEPEIDPLYELTATGLGFSDMQINVTDQHPTTTYEIGDVNYSLFAVAEASAIPEPASVVVWGLLFTYLVRVSSVVAGNQRA